MKALLGVLFTRSEKLIPEVVSKKPLESIYLDSKGFNFMQNI